MTTIQEYLNQNEPKERTQVFLEGVKIGKVEGDTLIVEDYKEIQYLYISDLPNLTKLILRNCPKLESLELYLDKQLEIEVSTNVIIKNIKTNSSTTEKSFIISYEKPKFCWNCVISSISLTGLVILATYVIYLVTVVNKLKKKLASVE